MIGEKIVLVAIEGSFKRIEGILIEETEDEYILCFPEDYGITGRLEKAAWTVNE